MLIQLMDYLKYQDIYLVQDIKVEQEKEQILQYLQELQKILNIKVIIVDINQKYQIIVQNKRKD